MALSRCMNLDNLELDHSSFGHKPKLTTIDLVGGIYCSLCQLIMPNKKSFDSHYRTHSNEITNIVYTCVVCMKQFGTYPIFRDHCYNIHVTKEKFKCKHCDKNFSKRSVLLGHIKSVHTLQCQECAQSFTSKEDLQLHKTMSHKKEDKFPYPCSACGHKIYSADACEQHIDEISIITFPCPICQDILPTKPEAIKHVLKHFDISEDINIDESDEPNFVEDSSIDMLGVQCCYCKAMLKNRMEINVHICEEHPGAVVVYTCNICHKQYPAAKYNTFVDHCYAHLTRNKYECTECDKSFPRLSLFVVHTEACHTSPGSTLCEDTDDAKPYKCWCCPHSFQTERRLTFHLRHQHKAKDLCCDEYGCHKTFLSLKDLLIHQREHKQTSKNLCRFCGLQFVSLASCTNHIEVHRIKNYGCPICPNKYKEKHTLVKHIPFHFECVLHICKICGKSYNAKNRLIQHSKTHSEARTYKCEHCGKGFFKPHELQQHVNVHTGMKPYKCMVCLKAFASYPNWTKHVRKVHNIDVKKYKKEQQNYPQPINNVETVKMIPTESMDNKKVDEINNCRVDSMMSEISTEVSLESEDSTMDSIASSTLEKELEIIKNNIQCMDGDFADILSPTDTFMDSEMDATPQPLAPSTYPTEIGPDFITLDGDNPNGEFINLDENILLPYIDPLLTIKCANGQNENAMNKNIDRDINYSIDYSNIHIDNNVNWEPPVYTFNPYYRNDLTEANILSIMDNMF